ncbi:ABC transporter substrate-binding protein [Agromyces silvae]|uniref:ABC transporter substrate-binding protein n=1 Tax=Agromyces silvae TaxID=3388266 RepID=UPI00280B977E|nr:ABC transporter substrate-binding protein [Agromyces protaetiae]
MNLRRSDQHGADARRSDRAPIRIGALAPLSPPGWTEAGRHLLAGLALGVDEINASGGVDGHPLELLVRDTSADPHRAADAVRELERLDVVALVGEYHSVAAQAAAATADALGVPFLCSSAVLDAIPERETRAVARLAPAQSHGWRVYGDFLLDRGHRRIAVAIEPSVYWAAGARLLAEHLAPRGGSVIELDARTQSVASLCDAALAAQVTAILLLTGHPEPATSIVRAVRHDDRMHAILLGAPAGQPEFPEWAEALGVEGAGVPFLRYLPERLTPIGVRVDDRLRRKLGARPSFVAFEGFDSALVLASVVRTAGADRARIIESWSTPSVAGSRGVIQFSRVPDVSAWQWAWAPVQVVDRDPASPERLRVLYARS